MNPIEILANEHAELIRLAEEHQTAHASGETGLVQEIQRSMTQKISEHIEAEEEILFPALISRGGDLKKLAMDGISQHREIFRLMGQIEFATADAFGELSKQLTTAIKYHSHSGSGQLFPEALSQCSQRELDALGSRLAAVRRNIREDAMLPQLLAFTLNSDSNCLDIGSHGGSVLRQMVRCAPRGRHIAYEPIPNLAVSLRAQFPMVDVRQAAVGAKAERSSFFHVTSAPAYSGLKSRAGAAYGWPEHVRAADVVQIAVDVHQIDTALPEGWAPDLVKIDVEGAEGIVISGALETIASHRPIVVFEYLGRLPAYQTDPTHIWDLLVNQAGLRIYDLHGGGPYTLNEFLRSAEYLIHTNYVARP